MGYLFTLLIILTLVTLVGHGIWVLLAAINRALSGGPVPAMQKRCLFCGQLTAADARRCDWCGRETTGQTAEELADIEAFVRQVKRLQRAGSITDAAANGLLARAETYRKRLLGPPAVQPARSCPNAAVWGFGKPQQWGVIRSATHSWKNQNKNATDSTDFTDLLKNS